MVYIILDITTELDYGHTEHEDDDEDVSMEPDMLTTGHLSFVDGRCRCCPYGFHIDLDFLRYLDSLNKQNPQHNGGGRPLGSGVGGPGGIRGQLDELTEEELRELHEQRRQFRQSMERTLLDDENVDVGDQPQQQHRSGISLDSNTQHLRSGFVLDSANTQQHRSTSSRLDDQPLPRHLVAMTTDNRQQQQVEEQKMSAAMVTRMQTVRSEPAVAVPTVSEETTVTTEEIEEGGEGVPAGMTLIHSNTLQTIREQMAACLQRLKELEDENRHLKSAQVCLKPFLVSF